MISFPTAHSKHFGLTLLLPLRLERERCCIANPNFITSTSAFNLHSAFLEYSKFYLRSQKARVMSGSPLSGESEGAFQNRIPHRTIQTSFGLTLLLPLRLERELCCIANPNYITTTSVPCLH